MKLHLLLSFLFFLQFSLWAQEDNKSYEYKFYFKDSKGDTLYLSYQFQSSQYIMDSAAYVSNEPYRFANASRLPDGMYILQDKKGTSYLSFIIDQESEFQYFLDSSHNPLNFRVENSPANAVMLSYQQKIVSAQQRLTEYQGKLHYFSSLANQDSVLCYRKALWNLNMEMQGYTYQMIENHPDMLFAKMQKAMLTVEVPLNNQISDPAELEAYQRSYYIKHYWDNFDFQDERLLFIPIIYERADNYILEYLFYLDNDTIINLVDDLIGKCSKNPTLYYFFIERLTHDFSYNLLPDHDLVYMYLMRKYCLRNDFQWRSEEERESAMRKMKGMEPFLKGKKSPELIMADTSGKKFFSTYHTQKEYTILWFIDPECELCAQESEKLREVYLEAERNGTRNFEVYSVGIDENVDRWKHYVKEKNFPWINVGGKQANIDYIKAFNVLGNPWMMIIDADHNFILNRRIDAKEVPEFLRKIEMTQSMNH